MFDYSDSGVKDCLINDPSTGYRGKPGCVAWEKGYESPLLKYRFNSSGYRSDTEFGPKHDDTYRIVMEGSSIPMGYEVESDKALAALLPEEISSKTNGPVELLNEAIGGGSGVVPHLSNSFDLKPDMVLWVLTPWDIAQGTGVVHHVQKPDRSVSFIERAWPRIKQAFSSQSLSTAIERTFSASRTSLMLRHFLYESQSMYVKSYLMGSDHDMGFLRAAPSAEWEQSLHIFGAVAAENQRRCKAAGVTLAVVLVPSRAQAAMVSSGKWPAGYDPYMLDRKLRALVTEIGAIYVDILPDFRDIPNSERYYLPADGHPNAAGHALLAGMLAKQLTSGAIPALSAAPRMLPTREARR